MDFTLLILVGLFVGVVGGMFGVGGAIILIPALTEVLGPNQHLYQATAMIVNLFVAVPAVYQHHRVEAIDFRAVLRMTPLAALAVLFGVGASELRVFSGEGEAYLRGLFGLFLLAYAAYDAYGLWTHRDEAADPGPPSEPPRPLTWPSIAIIAVPTGFLSGLLGVGGGVVAVPLQRRILHLPMRTAIANSAAIIVTTSFVGAIFKNYAYLREADAEAHPILLAAILIPTAIAGSLLGSRMTHRLPLRTLKPAFSLVLLASGLRLLHGAMF